MPCKLEILVCIYTKVSDCSLPLLTIFVVKHSFVTYYFTLWQEEMLLKLTKNSVEFHN